MAKITNNFKVDIAKSFRNVIKDVNEGDSLYAAISFSTDSDFLAYIDSDSAVESDEFTGGLSSDFDSQDSKYYSQFTITQHKLLPGGVSRVISRVNWTKDTNYYADDQVLVTEVIGGLTRLNVYKCLYHPNKVSKNRPTGTNAQPFEGADNYFWQYMFTVDSSLAIRFLTQDYVPVAEKISEAEGKTLTQGTNKYFQYTVQTETKNGTVYDVKINDKDKMVDSLKTKFGSFDDIPSSMNITVKNSSSASPKKAMSGTLNRDDSDFTFTLLKNGEGYNAGSRIKFSDSDGANVIEGIVPVVSPRLGHGSNAPMELNANKVMLVVRNTPEGDFLKFANSKFNMLNLVKNPVDSKTGKIATNDFYIACKSITFAAAPNLVNGDIIKNSAATIINNQYDTTSHKIGRVVAVDGKTVYYVNLGKDKEPDDFSANEDIYRESTLVGTVSSIADRSTEFNSGEYLMVDYKVDELSRSSDQIESFNFIISF